jgi:pimeloyl-ACP methyl ester carboxylesterase
LFVDVDGVGFAPVDGKLEQRPTLLLLHGGPGIDHAPMKIGLGELRDVAQVVWYDQRGHGRSDWRTQDEWNLDTWADDVVRLCDALGIEHPIVFGGSFGGFVAQRYIGRHPDHPSKVVLGSTVARWRLEPVLAMFRQLGGDDAAAAAEAYWHDTNDENRARYLSVCGPLYTQQPGNVFTSIELIRTPALMDHWSQGEHATFDLRPDVARANCPVLVMAGELDPVCPITGTEELVAHLPAPLVQFRRFANCGHGVFRDDKDGALAAMRAFITG